MGMTQVQTREMADEEDWWSRVPPLQALTLNSVVADVAIEVAERKLTARGYAVGSPAAQVGCVDVSIDGGRSWTAAEMVYQEGRWSWTLWQVAVTLPEGEYEDDSHGRILSRATDVLGGPQQADTDWNLRGVEYSGFGSADF